jgi:hypothetical protein
MPLETSVVHRSNDSVELAGRLGERWGCLRQNDGPEDPDIAINRRWVVSARLLGLAGVLGYLLVVATATRTHG